MIEQIKEIIASDINPMLELHAGGCELLDVDDGIVTLRLFGGCSGCPSSQITLFNGIVRFFGIKYLKSVTWCSAERPWLASCIFRRRVAHLG